MANQTNRNVRKR